MSEPTRDDLMVVRGTGGPFGVHHHLPGYTKLTDAEFDAIARKWAEDNGYVHFGEAVPPNEAWEEFARSNGYVKLDVDVEALRDTLHWMAEKDMGPDMDPRPAVLVGWRGDLVRKVLDAVLDALGGSDAPA